MNKLAPKTAEAPPAQIAAPEIAAKLIAHGYRPVPCVGKRVLETGWTKRDFCEWDFTATHNVGIKTGQGVALVDIDVTDPEASAAITAEWLRRHKGAPQRTGKAPKTAFLVASGVGSKIEAKLSDPAQKIEVLASGQQFVAYGVHPDTKEPYHWHGLDPLDAFLGTKDALPVVTEAELKDFLQWVKDNHGPKEAPPKLSEQAASAAGFKIDLGGGSGKFWRAVNDAALQSAGTWVPALFPAAKKHATGAWRVSSRHIGRDLQEDLSIHPSGIQDFGTEVPLTAIDLVQRELGGEAKDAAFWLCEKMGATPENLGWQAESYSPAKAMARGLRLVTDKTGRPYWNTANAVEILTSHDAWRGVLAYNEFTRRRVLLKPIPGTKGKGGRNLEDDDATAVLSWFNRNGFPKATSTVVLAAMHAVARLNAFDPLKDYLSGLKWDGTRRIEEWLITYCGAELSDYTREIGQRWLISAVARAMKPGCKADHMLVLEGEQGARKSSALAALAGEEWFSDALPPMNTKDASSYLRGRWIVEVAELEAMRREMDAVKAFISRQIESYRPAYGREEVDEPRRCVFAGTTNKDAWLRDETGGRRFWPVKVGYIDLDAIKRDRAQLWAEAVTLFRGGAKWWLEGEAEETARQEQASRMADDPWLQPVSEAAEGRSKITIREIMSDMGFSPADMTRKDSDRIAAILKRQGWKRGGRVTSGPLKGQAVFTPPD